MYSREAAGGESGVFDASELGGDGGDSVGSAVPPEIGAAAEEAVPKIEAAAGEAAPNIEGAAEGAVPKIMGAADAVGEQ